MLSKETAAANDKLSSFSLSIDMSVNCAVSIEPNVSIGRSDRNVRTKMSAMKPTQRETIWLQVRLPWTIIVIINDTVGMEV